MVVTCKHFFFHLGRIVIHSLILNSALLDTAGNIIWQKKDGPRTM